MPVLPLHPHESFDMTYLRYIGPALLAWFRGLFRLREVRYKPGWGPWKFLPVYLTTYLAGTIAGYGVVSLSRAWYERSQKIRMADGKVLTPVTPGLYFRGEKWAHPFARFMTRLLDWAFPGSAHGRHAGPRLWGVQGIR